MPKPWELYTPQETSTPPWEKFSEEKTKPWDSFKESFGSAKKTLGSMIGKVRKPIDLLADTSTELATTGGLDFSNQQPADLQNQPSLIPFKEQGQITPEEQKIQSEVNLDVDLFQLADNIATVGFDSKDEAMKVKKRQDFIMSRAPLIASGMASPIAVMGFEIFNQLKGLSVSSNTGQKYDPLQTKQLTDLLPDDTPQPLRLGLSVGEMVGDVALLGTLLNMANKGILDSTLKEVESKMTNRGYSKEDVKSASEVLKNVVKGSTEKNIKASFGVEKWEPMVQVKPSPKLPGVKGVVKGGVKGTEIVKPKSIPEITPKIPESAVVLPEAEQEISEIAQGETITLYRASPNFPSDKFSKGTYFADNARKARYYAESHYKGEPSDIKIQQFTLPQSSVFKEPSTGNYRTMEEASVVKAQPTPTTPPDAQKLGVVSEVPPKVEIPQGEVKPVETPQNKLKKIYHGSNIEKIDKFELMEGLRTGAFGGLKKVKPGAVFFTKDKSVARFMADDRVEGIGRGKSTIHERDVDLGKVLDMRKISVLQKALDKADINANDVYGILTTYGGETVQGLLDADVMEKTQLWKLFDEKEWTDKLISAGYDSAIFPDIKGDTIAVMNLEKLNKAPLPQSDPLVEEARKYKSAEEWVSTYRGSATQYSGYNPNIRKFGTTEGSERISDLGVDPELDVTIYRGVSDGNKKLINAKIVDGDFVTTDSMSAESYAGKNNVVSMKVKAKDLIHDFPDEFDSNKPFGVGAEFIYSDNKNKLIKYTDKQLTEIWNKANKVDETSVKQTIETPKSDPLVEEARKYKSAEEFVKRQNIDIKDKPKGIGNKISSGIYQGFTYDNAIKNALTNADTDIVSVEVFTEPTLLLSDKKKISHYQLISYGQTPRKKSLPKSFNNYIEGLLKTKSQLTEIWNKANKVDETSVKQTIEKSGGQFIGIQEGFDDVKSMAMFNDPKTGSTLSLPIDGVTSEAVSEKLGKTEKVFKRKPLGSKKVSEPVKADKKLTEESGVVANPLEVAQKTKEYVNKNWTTLREKIEDDWIRVKKLTQKEGVKLTEANNPYEAETRYWGRVGTRMEDTLDQISDIDKGIAKVEKKYKSPEINKDIDRYLIAKHAPERNVVHGEESAGITSEQASKNIKEIEGKSYGKEVKQIAKDIKKLNEKTLDVLLEGEVISQGDYDKLRKLYPNHIPLNRVMSESEDFVQILTSRGFNVQGTGIKRAFGSKKEVADILGNVTANLRSAIARSEKNIVDNHTLNFARDNDYFDGLFEEIKPKTIGKTFEGGFIQEHINDPSVLPVREKGKQVYLKINDPQIAVAFRGVNRIKVDDLTRMVAAFTRFYAGLMTRFNPEFAVPNKVRDLQETMVYMASKKDIGFSGAAKTAIKDPVSIKAVVDYMGGKDTEGARLYQQMKEDGGTTGGLGLSTKKQTEIDIDKIRRINRNKPRKVAEIALRVVDNWNAIFEDSTRLSVYRQSLSQGLSRKKSAVYAKEASINFNKMGALSPMTNGIWMFSNASVQGSAKMLRAMRDPKVAGMVLATIGGSIYAINEYNDKIDPEWRSKVSEWDRLNGITIMLPSNKGVRYITIPVSWGLKPIKVGMDYFIDYTQGHETDIKTAMSKVLAAISEGYNPVGGTDIVSAVTPTILDLPVDISRNRSWTGGKIRPNWNQSAPDSIKYFDSLKDKLMGKKFIGWTRKLGEKGIEISPADMNYAFQQLVGGTGRFTQKVFETISGVKKGKIEAKEIPFISRFYRDIPEDRIRGESKEFESLKDALKKQDKERFYFNQEAELVYEGMKQIPAKEANENYNKMKENNPRLAKKIKHLRENEKYKLTYIERLTKQLGVTNGERSKYIWSKVSELKTGKEKNTYLKDLRKKKIISDNVWEQLVSMSKKKGKKTLGSKIGKDLLNENK